LKRFDFRLDSVLNWRKLQSQQEQATLEKIAHSKKLIEQQQAEVAGQIAATANLLSLQGSVEASELHYLAANRLHLRKVQDTLRRKNAECTLAMDAQRHRCMEADRKQKLIEKMKAKQFSAWEKDVARDTEQTAAELFLAAHIRGNNTRAED
jgi:flagellar biosynthesis chaperone FliJ